MTRAGGTVVLVALAGVPSPVDIDACVVRELDLRGSYAYQDHDFAGAVEMVAGGMNVLGALTHEVPLKQAPSIFEQITSGLDYTKIVFRNTAPTAYRTGS